MTHAIKNKPLQSLRSALMWQAVGDALGFDYEFEKFPKVQDYYKDYLGIKPIYISDDTQMTYFGLRAMEAYLDLRHIDPAKGVELIQTEYLNWYETQELPYDPAKGIPKEFYHRMVPGTATMKALGDLYQTGVRDTNKARGCGSVMRLLPFLVGLIPDGDAQTLAIASGKVTHDHPESSVAVLKLFKHARMLEQFGPNYLDRLVVDDHRLLTAKKITDFGEGFYAIECVNMALWALVQNRDDPLDVLTAATVHSGDSDSVAAVTGCLYGLMVKTEPPKQLWDRVVEGKHLLTQVEKVASALGYEYN